MTELKHDPEFPYAIVFDGHVIAKFPAEGMGKVNAIEYAADVYDSELVDTTPKPKIPEDAQHITWGESKVAYSRYDDGLWYGWNHGWGLSDEEILKWIGDAEVTVLVRKGES